MKTSREKKFLVDPAPADGPDRWPLPDGWRKLVTRLRGTRLYQITSSRSGGTFWEAVVKLRDGFARRRFAGELHARAWLALATDRTPTAMAFDLEERHGRFRAAGVTAATHGPGRVLDAIA